MSTSRVPKLPPTDNGETNSVRYEVNPAIALNTLTDIYKQVQKYQIQLRQLVNKIHQVYAEGPVVSGWLASEASLNAAVKYSNRSEHAQTCYARDHASPSRSLEAMDVALFRHGDADDLMNYLSALESAMLENGAVANANTCLAAESPSSSLANGNLSQYYLCRLNSSGQIQTEQCPPEQVPVLSMAIARYRRLNQLIKQKQAIEAKLQAIVELLGDIQMVLAD
ncbi:hypothetical protein D0962_33770 [Leptolyngbyaceae cyanobacterium CCMR0082]|uniref:Uncharacterized protein n=1 Tax=Adonisia turfae CCMR0082 TaxID=2304604 RepID=A0A6M0SH23_9CYAN|nr:hypothetical protein [Adonisia turfae]MDV3347939.1 hypothetical protein [Leptothoe sp. LEGE 181152]NEZ67674.1 hypothetical protein [Adonisia turfae CCMR0082]